MADRIGDHAVVIGGSMAGMLAARVLTPHFTRVTVVERDELPDDARLRKGVPQARHPHALLARGRAVLDALFPGIHRQFLDAGAIEVEWPADLLNHGEAGWDYRGPRGRGLVTVSASRPLIDWVVRRNVLAEDGVEPLARHEVVGLLTRDGGTTAGGVRIRERGSASAPHRDLPADLVVDASGRESKAPKWLAELGRGVPEETRINPRQGYATAVFRRAPGSLDDWRTLVYMPYPKRPRGCVMVPVEGDRWIATVTGFGGDYPPLDLDGYLEYARSLTDGVLHDVVAGAELLEPIRGYRDMANVRRHYDKLPDLPDGFLVTGDAACAFNPVYAQGMTVAALGAEVLRDCVAAFAGRRTLAGITGTFQRALARTTQTPWQLATGQDLSFPTTDGKPGLLDRALAPYFSRVMRASAAGPPAAYLVNKVMHMMAPPSAMFSPALLRAALRPGQHGYATPELASATATTTTTTRRPG